MSPKYSLNSEDIKKWFRNTVLFLAPAAIIFLTEIQAGKPMEEALISLKLWAINTAIDLLRKFVAGY